MSVTQVMYSPKNINGNFVNSYTEYNGPRSPTWLDRISPKNNYNTNVDYYSSSKFNKDYFDGFRKRLQVKQ